MHDCEAEIDNKRRKMIVADSIEVCTADYEEANAVRYRSLLNGTNEKLISRGNCAKIIEHPTQEIRRNFCTEFELIDALWCEIPSSNSGIEKQTQYVCLAGEKNLMLAPDVDGHFYTITLPFKIDRVFNSSMGLILQKHSTPYSTMTPANFPYLFSLSHPYSEILPIICRGRDSESLSHYVWSNSELIIVEALNDCHLLLTYSKTSRLHSLYRVRKATKSEWKCAASKAESLVSFNSTLTPIATRSQTSTPLMSAQSKLRRVFDESNDQIESWNTPQSRTVRTRSMTAAAALIQSLPFPALSPAQRSTNNRSVKDSPILRLRRGSSHTTPRISSFCDESVASLIEMRGSEIDLLAPEVCIECIWTEPMRRQHESDVSNPASCAFTTTDFIGEMFACFYIREQELLRCVRIKKNDDDYITAGSFIIFPCIAAANINGRNMMAVVDPDGTVVMFSGTVRIGSLYAHTPYCDQNFSLKELEVKMDECTISICSAIKAVHISYEGHIVLESTDRTFSMCRLAMPSSSDFVAKCLNQINLSLPLDKALKLSISWCLSNSWRTLAHYHGDQTAGELAMFIEYIFTECGISIKEFPIFHEMQLLKINCDEGICEKKKMRTVEVKRTSAWEHVTQLKRINQPYRHSEVVKQVQFQVVVNNQSNFFQYALSAFAGLHGMYETAKLNLRTSSLFYMLATSLHAFARIFQLKCYAAYYENDFPLLAKNVFIVSKEDEKPIQTLVSTTRFSLERVPSWHGTLIRLLDDKCELSAIASSQYMDPILITIAVGLGRLKNVCDLQKIIGKSFGKKLKMSQNDLQKLTEILDNVGSSSKEKCEKLSQLFSFSKASLLDFPPSLALILCELLYCPTTKSLCFISPLSHSKNMRVFPSEEENATVIGLRWKQDLRWNNALQMLDSQQPIFIPSTNETRISEADQREAHEQLLFAVATRTVAQCFGRAAANLRNLSPPLNRPLNVPALCLQGRLHPSNTPLELSQTDTSRAILEWGTFYNAVATGLRLADAVSLNLDCEWLAMSASNLQGAASAGLMFAFGLNGHITNMNLFTVHELLSGGDRLMSIAILLGYAVSRRATADIQMHKMMVTHLPFMMGPTLLELHIDPMVQTAALVSLGLLFAQSSHLGILGQLVNEIGRPAAPDHEPSTDRYSYSLAAGIAIGLIALGRGEDLSTSVPFVEKYPSLASRLVVLMEGGPRSLCVFPTNSPSDLIPFFGQMTLQPTTSQPSNHAKESERVNTHLTANAATIALGLMYLRTGNDWAAKSLKIPDTISMIESVKPDVILLRTLCRYLVLWDSIEASKGFVEEAIPDMVTSYKKRLFDVQTVEVEGLRDLNAVIDNETIAETYLYAAAGACAAIAFRFAATWCTEAFDTIMHYTMMVLPIDEKNEADKKLCLAAGRTTCFAVLNSLIYSLAILMAGSGDLQVLRFCRMLRTRVTQPNSYRDTTAYSTYVAVSIAIGFLMMGRGRYALNTDDMSIAALLIAFFPVCPHSVSDNRMYLQPLRMLWTIAAEERLLCPLDAESEDVLEADVVLSIKATKTSLADQLLLRTPYIMPELYLIDKIQINSRMHDGKSYDMNISSEFEEFAELLRKKHGRIFLNPLGRKQQLDFAIVTRNDDGKCDDILKALSDDDVIQSESVALNYSLDSFRAMGTVCTGGMAYERATFHAYDEQLQRFQLENGSVAAQDYALSFIKDILSGDVLRFSLFQYKHMEAFCALLEKQGRKLHVIPNELIFSLRLQ